VAAKNALLGDLGKLIGALAANAGGLNPVLIAAPAQAMTLSLLAGPKFNVPVLPSAALASGTIIMVEPSSFVSGFDSVPEFSTSKVTLVHQEDTTPADIVSGGTAAVPVRSTFQTDSQALKMTLQAAWAMRAPHVAWLTGATW
jgi:hypothetical protein